MKVIFLDWDGVLNHTDWLISNRDTYHEHPLNPEAVKVLNDIVTKTGARIVISSTWRLDGVEKCKKHLIYAGFEYPDYVIGRTGAGPYGRGWEISRWIESHQLDALHTDDLVTHYVILDDDVFDMGDQMPHVVHIDRSKGLTQDDIPAILKLLEG